MTNLTLSTYQSSKREFMQGKRILIVEDDQHVARLIEMTFKRAGATVCLAPDGEKGLEQFGRFKPDLVLLDLLLPRVDGWTVCSRIVKQSDTPIIMITALNDDRSLIRGLEQGAVDYISKPFSANVLLARAQAALRQRVPGNNNGPAASALSGNYDDGYLAVDLESRQVKVAGQLIHLTKTEYGILEALLQKAGQVVTFEQILIDVWGDLYTDSINYVHIYVHHLRQKVEKNPKRPVYLESVRGLGYRFVGR